MREHTALKPEKAQNHMAAEPILDAIMRGSLDSIIVIDDRDRIVAINEAAQEMFGCEREEVLGTSITQQVIPERYLKTDQKGMTWYLQSGEEPVQRERLEISARRKDGTEFPVEITVIPAGDSDNPLFVSFIRDISAWKDQETRMRRAAMRSALLVGNLSGGILLENENRYIERVNQAFCDMFQTHLQPTDMVGLHCDRALQDIASLFESPQLVANRIQTIVNERKPVKDELVYLSDGRILSRDYVPILEEKKYLGHFWYYRDVTEELRTFQRWERLLKLEELNKEIIRLFLQLDDVDLAMNEVMAMTGQLLDVSRVYVFHFRQNERILDNTHEWCAVGIHPEIDNLQGLDFDELIPSFFPLLAHEGIIAPYHIHELPEDIRGILEPQGVQSIMHLPIYSDGRLEGFIGYDENRAGRVWLPEEITTARLISESYARALERQRTRDALVTARDNAMRSSRLKSQFVANMSHEIRTPMTGVMGMLELLTETDLDEMQREFASEAFNSASRLLHIINDILDFSKLEAGQMLLTPEAIDLHDIVREVQLTLLPQAKRKQIRLEVEIAADVPRRVIGDATRLRQVLMNFVGNAVKFTHEGQVKIELDCTSHNEENARISFSVCDTGIGIESEQLENIFDSFVQADGTVTRKFGGTGLGLAISRQLVELMEGEMHVESELGIGSTFSFHITMPVIHMQRNQRLEDTRAQFEQMRVLVFDEVDTSRYILMKQLRTWGVQVKECADVVELPHLLSLETTQDKKLNVIFLSLRQANLSSELLDIMAPYQEDQRVGNVVYIVEKECDIPEHLNRKCLQRPIDLSSLYNTLFDALAQSLQREADVAQSFATEHEELPVPSEAGRILLAEDHELNVDLVIGALKRTGYEIHVAKNGREVLEKLAAAPYDLVLMDVQMPVMDGMEATRRIRSTDQPWHNIPILALTASVLHEEQASYLEVGMDDIVLKPFSIAHLRTAVRHWISQGSTPKAVNVH